MLIRNLLTAIALYFLSAIAVVAQGQGGPGGGPQPPPNPWVVSGPLVSYTKGTVQSGNPAGGNLGVGTFNAASGYFVNGVNITALPCTDCARKSVSNTFAANQIININGGATPAAQSGMILQGVAANSTSGRVEIDTYAGAAFLTGVRSDGTLASPSTLATNDEIVSVNAWGYDGSTRSGPAAAVRLFAGSTWTTTNHATYIDLATTSAGDATKTLTSRFQIQNDGGLISTSVTGGSKGVNTINVAGLIYVAGNTIASSASSPLVLNPTTGALTCSTCVTSSGGGAITGTSPIVVSAAGAVSVQGGGGQVLLGQGGSSVFTSHPQLGTPGAAVGAIDFANVTSGLITLSPPTGALGSVTNTLQAVTDTFVYRATTDTLTNKTLTSSTNVLGGVTMTLGSDATGDIYYRTGGVLTRLPIGGSANVLTVSGGLPAWVAPTGGGNVSNTGTPAANQMAQWTNATTIQGVNLASLFSSPYGITVGGTTSPTLAVSLTTLTPSSVNLLTADITMPSSNTDVIGPCAILNGGGSCATAGAITGVWRIEAAVAISDTAGSANVANCHLTDGTTTYMQTSALRETATAATSIQAIMFATITNPAGNPRVLCQTNSTTGVMRGNQVGTGNSIITATRIQ